MELLGKIWQIWKRIGQAIGDFIGRIVLMIFYFTFFLPFGLGVRLLSDPLSIKQTSQLGWLPFDVRASDLNHSRRLS
jgi:hypothetical protein